MLRKFKQYTAKLFVSLLLFVPLLNGASASSDNLSYDVLSQQFIQAPADFLVPFSKKLYSFCLAKQILEKVESKKTELNSTITITPEVLAGHQSQKESCWVLIKKYNKRTIKSIDLFTSP